MRNVNVILNRGKVVKMRDNYYEETFNANMIELERSGDGNVKAIRNIFKVMHEKIIALERRPHVETLTATACSDTAEINKRVSKIEESTYEIHEKLNDISSVLIEHCNKPEATISEEVINQQTTAILDRINQNDSEIMPGYLKQISDLVYESFTVISNEMKQTNLATIEVMLDAAKVRIPPETMTIVDKRLKDLADAVANMSGVSDMLRKDNYDSQAHLSRVFSEFTKRLSEVICSIPTQDTAAVELGSVVATEDSRNDTVYEVTPSSNNGDGEYNHSVDELLEDAEEILEVDNSPNLEDTIVEMEDADDVDIEENEEIDAEPEPERVYDNLTDTETASLISGDVEDVEDIRIMEERASLQQTINGIDRDIRSVKNNLTDIVFAVGKSSDPSAIFSFMRETFGYKDKITDVFRKANEVFALVVEYMKSADATVSENVIFNKAVDRLNSDARSLVAKYNESLRTCNKAFSTYMDTQSYIGPNEAANVLSEICDEIQIIINENNKQTGNIDSKKDYKNCIAHIAKSANNYYNQVRLGLKGISDEELENSNIVVPLEYFQYMYKFFVSEVQDPGANDAFINYDDATGTFMYSDRLPIASYEDEDALYLEIVENFSNLDLDDSQIPGQLQGLKDVNEDWFRVQTFRTFADELKFFEPEELRRKLAAYSDNSPTEIDHSNFIRIYDVAATNRNENKLSYELIPLLLGDNVQHEIMTIAYRTYTEYKEVLKEFGKRFAAAVHVAQSQNLEVLDEIGLRELLEGVEQEIDDCLEG